MSSCTDHQDIISLTPKGRKVMVVAGPVHVGLLGGALAKVVPAMAQSISHAVAVILMGGRPESKTGDGSVPELGGVLWNRSEEGSMAYCQVSVASNSRSTAMGCWAFCASTFWLREISKA